MSFLAENTEQSPPIRLKFFSYLQIIGNKTFLLNNFNYYENEVAVILPALKDEASFQICISV